MRNALRRFWLQLSIHNAEQEIEQIAGRLDDHERRLVLVRVDLKDKQRRLQWLKRQLALVTPAATLLEQALRRSRQ